MIDNGGYAKDELFIKAKALRDQLFYCSHTWSHLDLTENDQVPVPYPTTYTEAYNEIMNNHQTATELFGGMTYPTFSTYCMVTPGISGLYNPNAIKALLDAGILHMNIPRC